MNGIIGMNGILLQSDLAAEQRECALAVRDCAESLLTLINDILDISKLETGKVDLEIIDFDLIETVEGAVALLGPKAREKQIDLAVFLDPAIQSAYAGDPTRLRQILLNLAGNAVKFTDAGGVSVEVTLRPGSTEALARLHFEVTDTGPGMSEEVIARLFQKFSQADNSVTRRFGGSGLGLAISRQLVELMGGRIGVSSTPGAGSCFWFEIDLAAAMAPAVNRASLPTKLKGLRALIVDDVEMNRRVMSRQLSGLGIESSIANDGFDALAVLERAWHQGRPFDLVVIDHMMPGLSGETLAGRIRAAPSLAETKLIIASSAGTHGLPSGSSAYVDAVLTKPVREQSLLDAFSRVFNVQTPLRSSSAMPAAPKAEMTPLRILLADDNKVNQRLAALLLRKYNHEVEIAENGEEAVAAMRRSDFDVVLMDVQMPVLDGVEATRRIRALPAPKDAVPIIALTAHAMAGARERYLESGMDDYLSKPLNPAELYAVLSSISGRLGTKPPAEGAPQLDCDPTQPDDSAIDASRLDVLASIMKSEDLRQFLEMYLVQADQRAAEIAGHAKAGDFEAMGAAAHVIVGVAGNVGAMKVSDLARSLEVACQSDHHAGIAELVTALATASSSASAALRDWLARDKASQRQPDFEKALQ